jgi:hypothetical protein
MDQLQAVGYGLVLPEQQSHDRRIDFVAYVPDQAGKLRPHAVVEVDDAGR